MINQIEVNAARLLRRLGELGEIGRTPQGGVARLALDDADRDGRDLVCQWMRAAGLDPRVDEVGNIVGTRPGVADVPPVMSGSHLDSVFNGGKLDGSYGVLAALEVIETLNDREIQTARPMAVAVFSNEEGVRFQPDMMGSLAYAGGMTVKQVQDTTDREGNRFGAELHRIGYAGATPCGAVVPHAFVELHIEQGPVLEREGVAIGAVEDLQGISWTELRIKGQANHAGTTPMGLRADAGYCAAALAIFVRDLATELGGGQVATVGSIELDPNLINVVPGAARVTVDLRNTDKSVLAQAEARLHEYIEQLGAGEGVSIDCSSLARFDPVAFDQRVVSVVEEAAVGLGLSCQRMTSGAGHDAQMMARIAPTAMIFVPSVDGVSHNPGERTDDDDLIAGANVLLRTLLRLTEAGLD